MKLYNTLTKQLDEFEPIKKKQVTLYSCGPTVYDHIHIGNLSAFIAADTLRRVLSSAGYEVKHVMNFTDVDDKTIKRSKEEFPKKDPKAALEELTSKYKKIFLDDMQAIGNKVEPINFVDATASIDKMKALIKELYKGGFAYVADDGVYFSIQKYKASGKKYGQLLKINSENTSSARINNDEYDKKSVHDFALWKTQKDDEPAWEFELDNHQLLGRPGWHIECSAMSQGNLGQPFDIHTGGIDLIFPHHENEIAQSTAGKKDSTYAKYFVHNGHLLVDGRKMSKSLNNFYTVEDVKKKGFNPAVFRLLVLQAHYRSEQNFTWETLEATKNRLRDLQALADLRFQTNKDILDQYGFIFDCENAIKRALDEDLNTPEALSALSKLQDKLTGGINNKDKKKFEEFLNYVDSVLGLGLTDSKDIDKEQKSLIAQREKAREEEKWKKSDEIRAKLEKQGLGLRDTKFGTIWFRL